MYSLIAFATEWGSKHGGINSFNTDFLEAFGVAYFDNVNVVCMVKTASESEIERARNAYVNLIPLPVELASKHFSKDHAQVAIAELVRLGIVYDPNTTVWLGHDSITGAAALEAAKIAGGRAALIHHMSYDHYESFAENSSIAYAKNQNQQRLFESADLVLAIGPLLRDAAKDLVGEKKPVYMLIPGLAEIEVRAAPKTFIGFLSGRLSTDAAKIKQSHLGIAAFARAHRIACENKMPDGLCKQPKLLLRGVDFSAEVTPVRSTIAPELELKLFAESYAGRAINLQALPYIHDREELYSNISQSSVALMPSWHEGFGLVAWEAIAAGVPLIVSVQSGVYQLLEEQFPGNGTGCVYPIDVHGSTSEPFFREEDLSILAEALRQVAHHPEKARQRAGALRSLLVNKFTWAECAKTALEAIGWNITRANVTLTTNSTYGTVAQFNANADLPQDLIVRMPEKRWKPGTTAVDSQLLLAEEAIVPFSALRQSEVQTLNAWLDDTSLPQTIRLITGAGGLGKTRLALHLCEQRNASEWHAGFLENGLDSKDFSARWKNLVDLKKPLLIVIDYAETRQNDLLSLVRVILKFPSEYAVRLLLLARDGGEWWDSLPAKDKSCEALLSSYATAGPFELLPLHKNKEDRQREYRHASQIFAKALGVSCPDVVPELLSDHFGRPLYLQMAALLALHGERPQTAQGLTRALLNHERRYWRRLFPDHDFAEPDRFSEQLMALSTLAGGFPTPRAALPVWEDAYGKTLGASQLTRLFYSLVPLYPGKQGLQTVRPDLLGEALVAQALMRSSGPDLLDAVLGRPASQSMRLNALTTLARLSNNYEELYEVLVDALARQFSFCYHEVVLVAVETSSNLPAVAESAFMRLDSSKKNQVAGALKLTIRDNSVQLASFNCCVSKTLVDKHRAKYILKKNNTDVVDEYASALNLYARNLVAAGRDQEAMVSTQQSLELYEQLARINPSKFMRDLAGLLANYANRLQTMGYHNEGVEASKKSLEIFRRLAQKDQGTSEADLALSLNNHANWLSNTGYEEEALELAGQAVKIRQRLADINRRAHIHEFAACLSNYSSHLRDNGRNEDALKFSRQALEIRRDLAQTQHDRFEPEYGTSLNNHAHLVREAGYFKEALALSSEAVDIIERLATKNPARFDHDLARSLVTCARCMLDNGRFREALERYNRALQLFARIMQENPRRAGERWFFTLCSSYLARWVCDEGEIISGLPTFESIPGTISEHQRPLLEFYSEFLYGIHIADRQKRSEHFLECLRIFKLMSKSNKVNALEFWLCCVQWLTQYNPDGLKADDWQVRYRLNLTLDGRISPFMLEVANRLEFEWPR